MIILTVMIKKSILVSGSLIVLFPVLFATFSCKKDNADKEETGIGVAGVAVPDNLAGIQLTLASASESQKNYQPTVISNPVDREDFAFCLSATRSIILTEEYLEEYYDDIWNFKGIRTQALQEAVDKDKNIGTIYWGAAFYDCGISSGISITADCDLFGISSGENLVDHFQTLSVDHWSHYIASYPDFQPSGVWEKGMPMGTYLAEGSALPCMGEFIVFTFDSLPEDMPNQFTLTISIPIHYTSWESLPWTSTNGKPLLPEDRTLEASIEVSFL